MKMKDILEQRQELKEKLEEIRESATDEQLEEIKTKLETLKNEERKILEMNKIAEDLNKNNDNKNTEKVNNVYEARNFGEFIMNAWQKRNQNDVTTDAKGAIIVPSKHSAEITSFDSSNFDLVNLASKVEKDAAHPEQKTILPCLDQDENIFGGVTMTEYDDDGAAINPSEVKFDSVTINDKMVAATVVVSKRLLENSRYSEKLTELFRNARMGFIEKKLVSGDKGYKNANATIEVERANEDEISYADVAKMYSKFRGQNGAWVVGQQHLAQLLTMQDASGRAIFATNPGTVTAKRPGTLLGIPVIVSAYETSISLVDLGYMYLSTSDDFNVEMSAHEKFSNAQVVMRAIFYIDNAPSVKNKILLEDEVNYVSPFVTLVSANGEGE